jgi:Transposase DDE domain group 1
LPALEDKAIFVDFDGGRLSSDGGLILLNDPDDQIGLTRDLAAVLRDPRDPRHFSVAQLLAVLKRLVKHLRQAWPDT